MQNLSKEDALWLLNVFAPMRMGTIGGGTIQRFVKAINLMKNNSYKQDEVEHRLNNNLPIDDLTNTLITKYNKGEPRKSRK